MKLNKKCLALALAASLLVSGGAYAATESVTANIDFQTAISLTKNNDIEFGTVAAGSAGNFTIATTGTVTVNSGTMIDDSTAAAASITITGSDTQTVAISTGTYAANSGVTPSAATCSYDGGGSTSCDGGITAQTAPGAGGRTLLVGVTAAVDGTQADSSTATPTFVVTVIYG